MKACNKCGETKPTDAFYAGFARCKACVSIERKEHYARKRDQILAYKKHHYEQNCETRKAASKEYRKANKDRLATYGKQWRLGNAEHIAAWREANRERRNAMTRELRKTQRAEMVLATQKRRATKLQAATSWEPEFDRLVLEEAATLAKCREALLGVKWHVDHVIPLRNKRVCGLHNAYNVAVIPALENLRKGNRLPAEI